METFLNFLPSLITAAFVVPFGWYFKFRMKNLATNHDFGLALKQLKKALKLLKMLKLKSVKNFGLNSKFGILKESHMMNF